MRKLGKKRRIRTTSPRSGPAYHSYKRRTIQESPALPQLQVEAKIKGRQASAGYLLRVVEPFMHGKRQGVRVHVRVGVRVYPMRQNPVFFGRGIPLPGKLMLGGQSVGEKVLYGDAPTQGYAPQDRKRFYFS